jgi:hypothetical protein
MKNDKHDQKEDFLISQLTSAVISLHQIVGSVSKKLNSLEKQLRHSQADSKAVNANPVLHKQIMLTNVSEDDELGMKFDDLTTFIDRQSTFSSNKTKTNPLKVDTAPQPSN